MLASAMLGISYTRSDIEYTRNKILIQQTLRCGGISVEHAPWRTARSRRVHIYSELSSRELAIDLLGLAITYMNGRRRHN